MSSYPRLLPLLVTALLTVMTSTLEAANVTATWNQNPEPDIAGYRLSYGTQSGVYSTVVDVGNVTTWPLTLAGGVTYFFVVDAYDTAGLVSPNSVEVPFAVPLPPTIVSLGPSIGLAGTAVTITGTHFGSTQGTSSVSFTGVAATPLTWSDTSIVAPVPLGASTGAVVVSVMGAASNA